MTEPLRTYLNDHLGGAQIAIQVLEAMCSQHEEHKFRMFAKDLSAEVQADDRTLRAIAESVGSSSSIVKRAGGWLIEKAARMKLGHTGSQSFEMFESLELLAVGVHGKLCLWKALQAASKLDARLQSFDFEELIRRAREQYDMVESERIELAQTVLAPESRS